MIIETAALMACSSMEVNDAEAVSDNYPSDFNASVYLELHPLLQTMQIMDYVKDKNAQFKASMDANTFKTKAAEDSIAFIGDTANKGNRIIRRPRPLHARTSPFRRQTSWEVPRRTRRAS